ncbi:hypothetical protein [Zhongshania aquimaris]|uniref:Lipoprotein n=1 Tax=Zhongshania aquimaris TaxID=2857107 RepID=A0ABS6VM80_9GAMM|nr:hypothetical protein [Zhongshania aquimaris]MBW2939420.1 hypothetical protein [Zhongshania aquimaris]
MKIIEIYGFGVFVVMLCTGCVMQQTKLFGFIVHNQSDSEVYQVEMHDEKDRVVYYLSSSSPPIRKNRHLSIGALDALRAPEYLVVRWKTASDGIWIEKKIDVESAVPKGFWGHIYVSVLSDESLALSWVMKRKHAMGQGTKDCGGYIFEHYYDEETKATIEKKMVKLNAYTVQKEKDIKAGLGDKYKTPKYYDTVEEADYRCNIYFYL